MVSDIALRFLATAELGRLARWLRLMGYDTAAAGGAPAELYRQAFNEHRILLTRNRAISPSRLVRVVQLQSGLLEEQLQQLVRELKLAVGDERAFTRCDRCNVAVQPIEKTSVKDRVPPYVYQTQEGFSACPSCRRVYWAATHWRRAQAVFERLAKA